MLHADPRHVHLTKTNDTNHLSPLQHGFSSAPIVYYVSRDRLHALLLAVERHTRCFTLPRVYMQRIIPIQDIVNAGWKFNRVVA